MHINEIEDIIKKFEILEKNNPKKFEQFRGRLDAMYEIEQEKDNDNTKH